MTISPPLMRRAKKQMAVIQWVTRTNAACRGGCELRAAASGTAESIAWLAGVGSIASCARGTDECVRPYTRLFAAYGQAVYSDGGGGYAAAEFEVAGDFGDVEEQVFQVSGHRDFFDGIS